MSPGFFLTVEGVDGAGKSTQARRLAQYLREQGLQVIETREPGGSPGAEEIRRLLLWGAPEDWSPETELLLFTAARRDHVERVVRPALAAGRAVICDRYVDSTRAYQGDGPLREDVDALHRRMIGLNPDLTLIFDLDPAEALARTVERGGEGAGEDRFEKKGIAFQQTLRHAFHQIAAAEPVRVRLIDARGDEDTVFERARDAVAEVTHGR